MEAEPKYRVGDAVMFKKPSVWHDSTGEVHGFVPDGVGKFVYRITIGGIIRWVTELYLDHYSEVVKSAADKRFEAMIRRV